MDYSSLIRDNIVSITTSHSKVCELCDLSYQKINKIVTNTGLEYNMCELCKVTLTYDKDDTYKIIILKSSMSQKEIINSTVAFFNKDGYVPSPADIDADAKRIDISSQLIKYLLFSNDTFYTKFTNKNFKIFVTPQINMSKFITINMFASKTASNSNYWHDVKKMNIYKIPAKIKKKIDKYIRETQNIKEIESSRERFNKKTDNLNSLICTMNELSDT